MPLSIGVALGAEEGGARGGLSSGPCAGVAPEGQQFVRSDAAGLHRGAGFLPEYLELMAHLGMKPRTMAIGKKEQNGTVEAQSESTVARVVAAWNLPAWTPLIGGWWKVYIMHKENSRRQVRLQKELAVMKPLPVTRLPEYREVPVRVSRNSTISVMHNIYSAHLFVGHNSTSNGHSGICYTR